MQQSPGIARVWISGDHRCTLLKKCFEPLGFSEKCGGLKHRGSQLGDQSCWQSKRALAGGSRIRWHPSLAPVPSISHGISLDQRYFLFRQSNLWNFTPFFEEIGKLRNSAARENAANLPVSARRSVDSFRSLPEHGRYLKTRARPSIGSALVYFARSSFLRAARRTNVSASLSAISFNRSIAVLSPIRASA